MQLAPSEGITWGQYWGTGSQN